ncbi:uncharacterized protein [Paramisgurnus dabryanus]|uniref:uncharacterized protein n=1 Tax=Paramisgurnus dabryanus TaxID=90735 RepID=UPI003CCFA701
MSDEIYNNVLKTEIQVTDRMEMMVVIYESGDDLQTQTDSNTNKQQLLQSTGGECVMNRSYRSVTVCLVLLCVLLLTAVIVLCVLIYTNNQQLKINNKKLTEEKHQLLSKYTNITEERDQLVTKCTGITKEREQLLTKYTITDGWIYYQSSLYLNSSEQKSWIESRSYCRERGADLIIINNKEEQDFLKNKYGNERLWIGLSDSDEEGRWKWVDGSTLTTRFWASVEPNSNEGDEDCVVFESTGWADYPCTHTFKWICERKLLK